MYHLKINLLFGVFTDLKCAKFEETKIFSAIFKGDPYFQSLRNVIHCRMSYSFAFSLNMFKSLRKNS